MMIYKKLPSTEFLCISDHLVAGRPVDVDDEAHLVNNYIIIIIIKIIIVIIIIQRGTLVSRV